jgi:hypothetical protein
MQSFLSNMGRLVITAGATSSQLLSNFRDARAIGIFAGTTAHTGTIKVQVAPVSGLTLRDLTSAGSDVVIQAGKCVVITEVVFEQIRLISSLPEGASRYFRVMKRWEG